MLQTSNPLYVEDLINDSNFNIDNYCGYIYMTCHDLTGRRYIGKKVFHHTTTKKLGKKDQAAFKKNADMAKKMFGLS